jgi:N-acetylneuraminic acid mutarotase
MPTPRGGYSASSYKNKIYVFGGETQTDALKNVEVYDPSLNSWTIKNPMPIGRHGHGSVVDSDKIYIISGGTEPDWSFSDLNSVYNLRSR